MEFEYTLLAISFLAFVAYLLALVFLKPKKTDIQIITVPANLPSQSTTPNQSTSPNQSVAPQKKYKYTVFFHKPEDAPKFIGLLKQQKIDSTLDIAGAESKLTFITTKGIKNLGEWKKKGSILNYECEEIKEECLSYT
jgi:SUMO ligase MMS21 Smc5/6 complex component